MLCSVGERFDEDRSHSSREAVNEIIGFLVKSPLVAVLNVAFD